MSLGEDAIQEILCNGEGDQKTKCKYCGVGELVWKNIANKWRLYDVHRETLHQCKYSEETWTKAL